MIVIAHNIRSLHNVGSIFRFCDVTLEIPMIGHKQSLNVSVAAGIALFALTRPTR